jgi:hypothetical protein
MHEIKAMLAMQYLATHATTTVNPKLIAIAVDHAEAVLLEIDTREGAKDAAAKAADAPTAPPAS